MIIGLIIIAAIVGLDQGLKHLAKFLLEGNGLNGAEETVTWISHVLEFKYVENPGAAWGMLEGKQIFFFLITIVALGIFGYLFTKSDFKKKKVYSLAVAFLIAGTLGNAIDRLFLSYVIDFIHVPFLTYILKIVGLANFYFNIADLALTVGVVLVMVDIFFLEPKRNRKEKETERVESVYDGVENKGRDSDENW